MSDKRTSHLDAPPVNGTGVPGVRARETGERYVTVYQHGVGAAHPAPARRQKPDHYFHIKHRSNQ